MMGKTPSSPDPPRLGDKFNGGSSTGWTDEKHTLYICSLEESFVTQMYNRDVNSKGLFCRSQGIWHQTSINANGGNRGVDQGYSGIVKDDGAESRLSQSRYMESTSCSRHQEANKVYCFDDDDDDASTNDPRLVRTSNHVRQKNNRGSPAFHLRQHGHSLSRRAESSDQNFIDGETEGTREQRRLS
ncbi:hypothetical protein ACP4OV_012396 [Aristida adscensionis]